MWKTFPSAYQRPQTKLLLCCNLPVTIFCLPLISSFTSGKIPGAEEATWTFVDLIVFFFSASHSGQIILSPSMTRGNCKSLSITPTAMCLCVIRCFSFWYSCRLRAPAADSHWLNKFAHVECAKLFMQKSNTRGLSRLTECLLSEFWRLWSKQACLHPEPCRRARLLTETWSSYWL